MHAVDCATCFLHLQGYKRCEIGRGLFITNSSFDLVFDSSLLGIPNDRDMSLGHLTGLMSQLTIIRVNNKILNCDYVDCYKA